MTLPYAVNVAEIAEAPVVSVRGTETFVDGVVVQKLPEALELTRKRWEAGHKGASFPGVALLQLPHDLPLGTVVAVVHAAAHAGYGRTSILVSNIPRPGDVARIARLPVDAFLPADASSSEDPTFAREVPEAEEKVLHVESTRPEKYTLIWKQGTMVASVVDVPRSDEQQFERGGATVFDLPGLAAKVQGEWQTVGVHRDAADPTFDLAVVHLDSRATLAYVVGVIDAISRSHRPSSADGSVREVPTFRVALAMPVIEPPPGQQQGFGGMRTTSHSIRQGTVHVNGRLPPEVIQRIVRQNFGRFRLCYENGLRNNPRLAGQVTVKFTIDATGSVSRTADDHSSLGDQGVVSCVVNGFGNLSFPQPEHGDVKVTFEMLFTP